ncbi:MAG: MFS transporter [Candidatus Dormibacteraeota bacterium]|nr:MFS transporter [Candidatus Dormibacteraeota bacterium]
MATSDENTARSQALVWPRAGGPLTALIIISGSHAVIHAYSTLMPLIYPLALTDLHFSVVALGIMVALSSLAGGMLQLGAGALTRVIQRHSLIGWGAIAMGLAGAMTATAGTFAQFFAGNLLRSVATSTQHPVGNSLLTDLYERGRRGVAISGHVAGGNLGTVFLTPLAGLLLNAWGWRNALLLLTIPATIAGVAVVVLIHERARPARAGTPLADMIESLRMVRRSWTLSMIFLASLIAAGGRGLGVVILVVPLYLKLHLRLSNGYVTVLYSVLLLGSVAGPLIGGPLSDRIGRRLLLLIAYPLSAVMTLLVLLVPASGPWLPLALAAMGLVVYVESPILQAFLADEAPAAQRDAIFSLYFAVAFGVGALWAAVVGAMIGPFGFGFVFLTMASTYLLAGLCVLAIRAVTASSVAMRE